MIVDFMLLVNLTVCDQTSAQSRRAQSRRPAWEVVDRPTYLLDCVAPAANGPCLLARVLARLHITERYQRARVGLVITVVV
jgi:hypothetical protein